MHALCFEEWKATGLFQVGDYHSNGFQNDAMLLFQLVRSARVYRRSPCERVVCEGVL